MKVPGTLVFLGDALELDSTDWIWTWNLTDKAKLYSTTDGKKLVILYDSKLSGVKNPKRSNSSKKGDRLYERFHEFTVDSSRIHGLKNEPNLKKLGNAVHIIYRSNKWNNKQTNYIHDFETNPTVWVDRPQKPLCIVISGGRLRVTNDGIEG